MLHTGWRAAGGREQMLHWKLNMLKDAARSRGNSMTDNDSQHSALPDIRGKMPQFFFGTNSTVLCKVNYFGFM
jgi:hypothetical protein